MVTRWLPGAADSRPCGNQRGAHPAQHQRGPPAFSREPQEGRQPPLHQRSRGGAGRALHSRCDGCRATERASGPALAGSAWPLRAINVGCGGWALRRAAGVAQRGGRRAQSSGGVAQSFVRVVAGSAPGRKGPVRGVQRSARGVSGSARTVTGSAQGVQRGARQAQGPAQGAQSPARHSAAPGGIIDNAPKVAAPVRRCTGTAVRLGAAHGVLDHEQLAAPHRLWL